MFLWFFHMADCMPTTSLIFSVVFFAAALVSALAGLAICAYMAERVRLEYARDMIGGVTGLVVTLVALVLGLLIWTAFGVFSTQKAELQGIAANALEFNQETREYGPEAAHARALMRTDLDYAHRQLWGDDQTKAAAIAASICNMDSLSVVLDHMEPTTDAQKSLLADAKHNYEAIWQSRILMSLQGVDAVSWAVLYVVSAWTCIAFFLTGLNSNSSRATIAVAALGSFCVASAMFLILELSQPYTSSMRVSSDGIHQSASNSTSLEGASRLISRRCDLKSGASRSALPQRRRPESPPSRSASRRSAPSNRHDDCASERTCTFALRHGAIRPLDPIHPLCRSRFGWEIRV